MIIDLLPDPPDSYLRNCLIQCKPDADDEGAMFIGQDGLVLARLDGYAIIPRDEYESLVQKLYHFEHSGAPTLARIPITRWAEM